MTLYTDFDDDALEAVVRSRAPAVPCFTSPPSFIVIAGLDPAIQSAGAARAAFWMPGSSPGMTVKVKQ